MNRIIHQAIPDLDAGIKKVIVYSNDGMGDSEPHYTEVTSSNCYITVPALIEVDSSKTSEPYNSEGVAISYMSNNTARKRAFDGGDYYAYWTRSPNVGYANYVWSVGADGSIQGITPTPPTDAGVLIEISF